MKQLLNVLQSVVFGAAIAGITFSLGIHFAVVRGLMDQDHIRSTFCSISVAAAILFVGSATAFHRLTR